MDNISIVLLMGMGSILTFMPIMALILLLPRKGGKYS